MQEILKRLRVIKLGIQNNDFLIINLQINSINKYLIDDELKQILDDLVANLSTNNISRIDTYISNNKNSNITFEQNTDTNINSTINKTTEEWMQKLLDWMDGSKKTGEEIARNVEELLNIPRLQIDIDEFPLNCLMYFTNLKQLSLYSSKYFCSMSSLPLECSIPEEVFSMVSLETLEIECGIYDLPSEMLNLINLKELVLINNQLVNIPDVIFELKGLKILSIQGEEQTSSDGILADMHTNHFTTIPNKISQLINLTDLSISGVGLIEVTEAIKELKNLQRLDISCNNIETFPKVIKFLKNLEQLKMLSFCSADLLPFYIEQNTFRLSKDLLELDKLKQLDYEDDYFWTEDEVIKLKLSKNGCLVNNDKYVFDIFNTQNIKFEKIRKHCENLLKANEADEMQKNLAEKGKMHKALIYSSLEVFIEKLNGKTITLYDWGCDQGIASMLVLDYIKEKQLDVKVFQVILIGSSSYYYDTKALSRAMAQVEVLAQNEIKLTATIESNSHSILDTINSNKNNIVIHLFANDELPTTFTNIDDDVLDNDFILFISNKNRKFVEESYQDFKLFMDVQDLSIRDGKIGRYDRYERIFKVRKNIQTIDIDKDEIPF